MGRNAQRALLFYLDCWRQDSRELEEIGNGGEDHVLLAETGHALTMYGIQVLMTLLRPTVFTATEKGQGMPLNHKVRLVPNGDELSSGETNIDIDDAVALRAGEMVVMLFCTTHPIVMGPISELNAGEQSHVHQFFDRTIHRRPAYGWLDLAELLPEIFHREICAEVGEFDQAIRNEFAWACVALAHLAESRVNLLRYHSVFLSPATHAVRASASIAPTSAYQDEIWSH